MPLSSSSLDIAVLQEFLGPDILQNFSSRSTAAMNQHNTIAPYLEIITQPCEKFRFRYYSEPGSHGVINGRAIDGKSSKKTYPTVKFVDPYGSVRRQDVRVRARLFTAEVDPRPHVLNCLNRNSNARNQDGAFYEELSPDGTAKFKNLGIFILKREEVISALQQRKMQELNVTELNPHHEESILNELKTFNTNETKIHFQVVYKDGLIPVGSGILSDTIYNSKATATNDLKICRLSLFKGSVSGEQDIIILCDKIKKDDVEIRFFEEDGSWETFAKFNQNNVHHQVAIYFKTPKYEGFCLDSEVTVYIQLIRKSDLKCGDPVKFIYKNDVVYCNPKKRKLNDDSIFNLLDVFDSNKDLVMELDDSYSDLSPGTLDDSSSSQFDIVQKDAVDARVSLMNENTNVEEISHQLQRFSLKNSTEEESSTVKKFLKCFSRIIHSLLKDKEVLYYTPSSLSVQDIEGNSILHLAIQSKQSLKFIEAVLKLINEDLVNHKNLEKKTPMHLATRNGNAELLELMLKNGGDPNLIDNEGNTCFHIAAMNGFLKCLQTLFSFSTTNLEEFSSKINVENDEGMTPLHLAIIKNTKDCVDILLKNNADVNKREKKGGKSPLHLAVEEKSPFLGIILSQANIDTYCTDYSGITALELACLTNNLPYESVPENVEADKEHLLSYLNEILEIETDSSLIRTNLEMEKQQMIKLQTKIESILNKSSEWKKLGQLIDFSEEQLKYLQEIEENPAGYLIEKIMEEKELDFKEVIKRAGLSGLVSNLPGWE